VQSVSLVWFISKLDSRVATNEKDMQKIMSMNHKYDEMDRQLDRLMWLLEQDSLSK
jgi:hypothetical protein